MVKRRNSHRTPKTSPAESEKRENLAQQYGGRHETGWVDTLPESWIPYIQLARLSPPVGVCLVLFPHVFGFLHGILLIRSGAASAPSTGSLTDHLIRPAALLIVGSFFLSNTIHIWNDLVDAPYDAKVARTRERPLVRGAISNTAAYIYLASQTLAGFIVLWVMVPQQPYYGFDIALPSIITHYVYPMSKQYTHFAQYVLGLCLAWGVVMGTAAVLESVSSGGATAISEGTIGLSTACLTAASALWTVIYDTIYAFQDREDDINIGLKSTAVLFGNWTKQFLFVNLGGLTALLLYVGNLLGLGLLYHGFAVGGCFLSLSSMITYVKLSDPASCWWWFRYGFWIAGGSIAVGITLETLF